MATSATDCTQGTGIYIRLRPPSRKEGGARCLRALGSQAVAYDAAGGASTSFAFDRVFGELPAVPRTLASREHDTSG
jgi:hypothetical protein